jgi:hypothetical protein
MVSTGGLCGSIFDTMTMLLTTLHVNTILITLNTGDITYSDITYSDINYN